MLVITSRPAQSCKLFTAVRQVLPSDAVHGATPRLCNMQMTAVADTRAEI